MRGILLFIGMILMVSLVQGQVDSNSELHKTVVELDKRLFDAYNKCDMETQALLMDEDLEFYHDSAGLATSKSGVLQSIKENICGKVTRTLVEGSIEVHEIPGFGAVQIGMHSFSNNQEPNAESIPSRFITIWKNNGPNWTITRVISLHK
ncbi:nuclear transport factor 2 family protein [Croceivirga thetidis]|uniref:Nuclear transport factor 2 family protein n=1 Tax=Croceivirga thetidis TaxID=2721623 RepID=A0ABX1GS62_9FLAO|nr:nuclear transport factor 2 family protein [Croceivirga thetidis]NKI32784.1 nuclear transport factor 2 family protein [Croceivirga thetidis]